jgi:hypothetical protein
MHNVEPHLYLTVILEIEAKEAIAHQVVEPGKVAAILNWTSRRNVVGRRKPAQMNGVLRRTVGVIHGQKIQSTCETEA